MYSKIWWKYSAATIGLLVFSLILTYQKPTVRKYQAWHRDLTQEQMSRDPQIKMQVTALLRSLQETAAFYLLEQGIAISSAEEPSANQSDFLIQLKRGFFENLVTLDSLINQLSPEAQRVYGNKRDILIFRARLFSRTFLERAAWAYNFVDLMSAEDLERTLSSREHAALILDAIEKFLTFDTATTSVRTAIDMNLQSQISLEERSALVQYARQSKDAIVALKRAAPALGLGPELQKRHNAAASLFEFTHASAHID